VLPAASTVDLTVFDLAGRKVRSLMTGEPAAAGEHVIRWDGRDGSGGLVSSGVYTLRVRAGSEVAAKRLVVLR
jgi:flagellar hook assembly protein FlgD